MSQIVRERLRLCGEEMARLHVSDGHIWDHGLSAACRRAAAVTALDDWIRQASGVSNQAHRDANNDSHNHRHEPGNHNRCTVIHNSTLRSLTCYVLLLRTALLSFFGALSEVPISSGVTREAAGASTGSNQPLSQLTEHIHAPCWGTASSAVAIPALGMD